MTTTTKRTNYALQTLRNELENARSLRQMEADALVELKDEIANATNVPQRYLADHRAYYEEEVKRFKGAVASWDDDIKDLEEAINLIERNNHG